MSSLIGLAIWMFAIVFIMMPMSAVVLHDFHQTTQFTKSICSGTELREQNTHSNGICTSGTVLTCLSFVNGTCIPPIKMVQLYFPSVNKLLACESNSKVKSWQAGLGATASFTCLIDGPNKHDQPKGISELYDKVAGWAIMMVAGILILLCTACVGIYIACCSSNDSSQAKAARNTAREPIKFTSSTA
jgi:hypothetical protein